MSQTHTLFEVSWEVCNKVGGIHTVVSTKAKTLVARYGDRYVCIGPWLLGNPEIERTFEDETARFAEFADGCRAAGVAVRVGRWKIPGAPRTILVAFSGLFEKKDQVLARLWERFKVDSIFGSWDYVEPVLFGHAAGLVIERWTQTSFADNGSGGRAVAQFHEWMTGAGLLYLEEKCPEVGSIFTTHATVLGRALSSTGRSPEQGLNGRTVDDLAQELGVRAKHSIEGVCAHTADVFTTVSEITAREAKLFFGRDADPLLPNGIDLDVIDELAGGFPRKVAEPRMREFAHRFLGQDVSDAIFVCLSGRYEYHNKGIDTLLDALALLNARKGRRIVTFLMVPAAHSGVCKSVLDRLQRPLAEIDKQLGVSTHNLIDRDNDPIQRNTARLKLQNALGDRVKVVQIPVYLNGSDGLLNMPYEAVLRTMDLSSFPSFYEPWGYTPEESLAVGVPTITTDYAGFGRWARSVGLTREDGVTVLERVGKTDALAAEELAAEMERWTSEPIDYPRTYEICRATAQRTAWTDLIQHYDRAIAMALERTATRVAQTGGAAGRPRALVAVSPSEEPKRPRLVPFQVSATLPKPLEGLARLARNFWWCWDPEAQEIFRELSPLSWETSGHNPISFLRIVFPEDLAARAADPRYLEKLERILARLDAYLAKPAREHGDLTARHPVAYFSAEFGLHESLPIYSGGLGILAGDHLKSASDLELPLVGVGLFYRLGYLRQRLTVLGDQIAGTADNTPRNLAIEPVLDERGARLEVTLELPTSILVLRAWSVRVGRITLYLLDSNVDANRPEDKAITDQLYGGDHETRLRQEIVLGRGGSRLLARLGIQPSVWHINEGHAAFLALERVGQLIREHGLTFPEARELVRATTVFTTHTPVPAGHDRFGEDLIRRYFSDAPAWVGLPWDQFLALGHSEEDKSAFNVTFLAMNFASAVNGVSKLHGDVSRALLHSFWPQYLRAEVPVGSITNGVHLPTWTHPEVARLFGAERRPVTGADFAQRAKSIEPAAIWEVRKPARRRLLAKVRESLEKTFLERSDSPRVLSRMLEGLDERALLVGFARRFAPYKRATLLFSDRERLLALLNDPKRPLRLFFAGKAHPRDGEGQAMLKRIVELSRSPDFLGKVFFLEDYDVDLARSLVQGVDVWLNNPIRPLEASGTSGMKAAANGALNLSIPDGWWVEAFDGRNGWSIGDGRAYPSQDLQDELDAATLYRLLDEEVLPLFFDRDAQGVPHAWMQKVRHAFETIPSVFNTDRMVSEYRDRAYIDLARRFGELTAGRCENLREVSRDHQRIRRGFPEIRFASVKLADLAGLAVGDAIEARVELDLKELRPADVRVELVLGHTRGDRDLRNSIVVPLALRNPAGGGAVFEGSHKIGRSGYFAYGIRVRARHASPLDAALSDLVRWA
ncbi:MAG: alpha-glucan family phosphorylase [Planctomycetes bacterium]|nr:alpha-glucan family phosphorylase [Planctomycetota bacterium]